MKILTKNSETPTCQVPGCCNKADNLRGGENPNYRKSKWVREEYGVEEGWVCKKHHNRKIAERRGEKSILHVLARNAGFGDNVTAYTNSKHPYLKYRKSYCENQDGRLGFTCSYTGPSTEQLLEMGVNDTFMGWLQVDHIDGNSDNNTKENLQTLCACCHTVKTAINKDYSSPGRKTLKLMKDSALG